MEPKTQEELQTEIEECIDAASTAAQAIENEANTIE